MKTHPVLYRAVKVKNMCIRYSSFVLSVWEERKVRLYGEHANVHQSHSQNDSGDLRGVAGGDGELGCLCGKAGTSHLCDGSAHSSGCVVNGSDAMAAVCFEDTHRCVHYACHVYLLLLAATLTFGVLLLKFSFRFPTTYGAHTIPRVHLVGSLNPSWRKTGTVAVLRSRGRYDCHHKFRTVKCLCKVSSLRDCDLCTFVSLCVGGSKCRHTLYIV